MRTSPLLAAIIGVLSVQSAFSQSCYDTMIKAPSPYNNNGGEVIVMMDGTVWQDITYNYSYLYEYNPTVTLCPGNGFMILNGKKIAIMPMSGGAAPRGKSAAPSAPPPTRRAETATPSVIESQIEGDFEGWSGDTVFKLTNGQVWQQSSYAYTYSYRYRPRVLIVSAGGTYVMQVEGVNGKINVERLR